MITRILAGFLVAVVIGAISFRAGSEFGKARYDDLRLESGGEQPLTGEVQAQVAEFRLGPIRVTDRDILDIEAQENLAGQPQVYLKLRPAIAGALKGFTAQSIGRNLNIWIHGEQVSSVQIAEAIEGTELVIALPEAQVESLIALLAADRH